jgi:hypothetical protein
MLLGVLLWVLGAVYFLASAQTQTKRALLNDEHIISSVTLVCFSHHIFPLGGPQQEHWRRNGSNRIEHGEFL